MSSSKSVDSKFNHLLGEFNIMKCKLDSKNEAVLILSKELEQCCSERDQFRLMADQLRERYSVLKRRVEGWGPSLTGVYDVHGLKGDQEKNLALMLCELKEKNKQLSKETNILKQSLRDAQGDIRLLREQQVLRQRTNSTNEADLLANLSGNLQSSQREGMVLQLESVRSKYSLLEKDLQSLLDEKEELVTARDAYKHKVERLNTQLNGILRGDKQKVVDIDSILMENRYLQERLKQLEEEITMLMTNISKYKVLLEKKKGYRSNLRITTPSGTYFMSGKQVQQILQTNPLLELPNNPSSVADLRSLVVALFETLGDKSLALAHQKKTNKILGNRINELEKRIKTMEGNHHLKTPCNVPEDVQVAGISQISSAENENASKNVSANSDKETEEEWEAVSQPLKNVADVDYHHDLDLLPTREMKSLRGTCSRSPSVKSFGESDLGISLPATPVHSLSPMLSDNQENQLSQGKFQLSSTGSEEEDLPPQLQKLLALAFLDLENNSRSHSSEQET